MDTLKNYVKEKVHDAKEKVQDAVDMLHWRKNLVQQFLTHFENGEKEKALELLVDDCAWQAMGVEGGLPMNGIRDKQEIGQLIDYIIENMPQGLKLTPVGWTIQDNRVAVEVHSHGVKSNGLDYDNCYHFLFLVENHKITAIREYMDTAHVKRVFVDNAPLG